MVYLAKPMFRPGTLFALIWSSMLLLGMGTSRFMVTIPLFCGFITGQALMDILNRPFAWGLPKIRSRLVLEQVILSLPIALLVTWLAPSPYDPQMTFAIALFYFYLGGNLKMQEFTIIEFKLNFSLLNWAIMIFIFFRLSFFRELVETRPDWVMASCFIWVAVSVFNNLSRDGQRKLYNTPFMSIANSTNKTMRRWYKQRRLAVASNRPHVARLDLKPDPNQPHTLVNAAIFEFYGGWSKPMLVVRGLALLFFVYGFMGYMAEASFFSMVPMIIFMTAFQGPFMLDTGILYPISREQQGQAAFRSCLYEQTLLVGLSALALLTMSQIPWPEITLGDFTVDAAFPPTDRVLIYAWVCLPIIQWLRRRHGSHMIWFMVVCIGSMFAISFAYFFLRKRIGEILTPIELVVCIGLIVLFNLGLKRLLSNRYARNDLGARGC